MRLTLIVYDVFISFQLNFCVLNFYVLYFVLFFNYVTSKKKKKTLLDTLS